MIKVFVMQTCPDCTEVKKLAENDPRFEVTDIGTHVRNLKQFLTLRDTSPAFAAIRRRGTVGIPCFVLEDGSVTFSAEKAGLTVTPGEPRPAEHEEARKTQDTTEGAACSIDGSGC